MSAERNYYVIGGYDLTSFKTNKYDDWRWTEQGEKYTCNQSKSKIQLFVDPMDGSYLYLGYIFASGDEYEFDTVHLSLPDIAAPCKKVDRELVELYKLGIIKQDALSEPFKLIVFEETR